MKQIQSKKKYSRKKASYWILYLALPVIIIAIWKGVEVAGIIKPYAMPAPEKVLFTAIDLIKSGELGGHILSSVIRVVEGFFLALLAALILGVAVGLSETVEIFTNLVIQVVKPIPPIAWIPLAILWFGIGEPSKIFIIFLGAFFPIFINVVAGIQGIDNRLFELASVYEVSPRKLITKVVLPGALPSIMTGVRVGLGNAWVCVVAAEMIAALSGVGYMLSNGRSMSRPDIVILGMLVIGIFGKIMDDGLKWLTAKLISWNA